MKTFEIEVVRQYTTTIEVELPDLSELTVERITLGSTKGNLAINDVYHEIWDTLGEAELEQCNTEILSVKAEKL